MYEIAEYYGFTATHRIQGLPKKNPGSAIHLHRWLVLVSLVMGQLPLAARPSETAELEPFRHHIAWHLDGKYLNDIWPIAPTPSRVAEYLMDWWHTNLTGYVVGTLNSITVSIESNTQSSCTPWRISSCRALP